MLSHKSIQSLFDRLRFNLSLEEIILNTRRLARFMLGENTSLKFALKPVVVKESFETQNVKHRILNQSYRDLGMNKSTHWYQRKRLEETGSVRIYNKTKHHFITN